MERVHELPHPVRVARHVWIPMRDGVRLSARMWLPEGADENRVPAILEYIPYRKDDATLASDDPRHRYLAGHGYGCVRVDLRGSGDSEGILRDEYLPQEQDDAEDVLAWLEQQAWCTGRVGMIGISWGGFNGLQVAARRPPQLGCGISLCSTDDRYADDVHYLGGCVLGADMLSWASTMLAYNARPPDPAIVGDGWRAMWLERLRETPRYIEAWLAHQRRDAFWKHGSVCEDYEALACPVYMVGGWNDGYTNAIPRFLAGLPRAAQGPDRALVAQLSGVTACPGRRSASCRKRCAGSTTGSRDATPGSWTSPCCASGCRNPRPRRLPSGAARPLGRGAGVAVADDRRARAAARRARAGARRRGGRRAELSRPRAARPRRRHLVSLRRTGRRAARPA